MKTKPTLTALTAITAVAAIAFALLSVDSCSNDAPSAAADDGGDTGPDAKRYDSGPISSDGAISNDAETVDGGAFVDGWAHVPWAPACALYQPSGAQRSDVIGPAWAECSSGPTGCMELQQNWSTASQASVPFFSVRESSGSAEVFMFREYAPYRREYLAWNSVTGVEGAWRFAGTGKECVEVLGDIGAGKIGITEAVYGGTTNVAEYRQVFGTTAELLAKTTPDYVVSPADIGFSPTLQMSQASASATAVSMYFGQVDFMSARDRSTGTLDNLGAGASRRSVGPWPVIAGSAIFFTSDDGIYAWTAANGLQRLLASTASKYEHDIATDGTTLAWIESSGNNGSGGFTSSILVTSSFATTAAGLSPHAVMMVPCSSKICESAMTAGYLTVGLDPANATTNRFLLVRMSDEAYWPLANGASGLWGLGRYAAGSLWIPTVRASMQTIQMIPLAALGAPQAD